VTASAGVDGSYSGTNISLMTIFKNGSGYKDGDYRQFTSDYFGADVTCIVDMNGTTDYIEAFFMQRTGGDRIIAANTHTYFQASLLSTSADINSIEGPQGPQGASIQGPQGASIQGPQGASIQGPQGDSIQGPQGASIQGPQGFQGPQGASGTGGTGGTASNFIELLDVPNSYSGQQGKFVSVNSTETGLAYTIINTIIVNQIGIKLTSVTGNNILITPGFGKSIELYRIDISVATAIDHTTLYLGSTLLFEFLTMKPGGMYGGNFSNNPFLGSSGSTLNIILPATVTTCINIAWREVLNV
jgi:hypothetical protein